MTSTKIEDMHVHLSVGYAYTGGDALILSLQLSSYLQAATSFEESRCANCVQRLNNNRQLAIKEQSQAHFC